MGCSASVPATSAASAHQHPPPTVLDQNNDEPLADETADEATHASGISRQGSSHSELAPSEPGQVGHRTGDEEALGGDGTPEKVEDAQENHPEQTEPETVAVVVEESDPVTFEDPRHAAAREVYQRASEMYSEGWAASEECAEGSLQTFKMYRPRGHAICAVVTQTKRSSLVDIIGDNAKLDHHEVASRVLSVVKRIFFLRGMRVLPLLARKDENIDGVDLIATIPKGKCRACVEVGLNNNSSNNQSDDNNTGEAPRKVHIQSRKCVFIAEDDTAVISKSELEDNGEFLSWVDEESRKLLRVKYGETLEHNGDERKSPTRKDAVRNNDKDKAASEERVNTSTSDAADILTGGKRQQSVGGDEEHESSHGRGDGAHIGGDGEEEENQPQMQQSEQAEEAVGRNSDGGETTPNEGGAIDDDAQMARSVSGEESDTDFLKPSILEEQVFYADISSGSLFDTLNLYVQSPPPMSPGHSEALTSKPAVVMGDVGSGKSTLLRNWALSFRRDNPDDWVIFVQVSRQLHHSPGYVAEVIIDEFEKLNGKLTLPCVDELKKNCHDNAGVLKLLNAVFRHASAEVQKSPMVERKIVLVIDGLNEVCGGEGVAELHWLPAFFPVEFRVIVSTAGYSRKSSVDHSFEWLTAAEASLSAIKSRGWLEMPEQLLTPQETRAIVGEYNVAPQSDPTACVGSQRIDEDSLQSVMNVANSLHLRALLFEIKENRLSSQTLEDTLNDILYRKLRAVVEGWEKRCSDPGQAKLSIPLILGSIALSASGMTFTELVAITKLPPTTLYELLEEMADRDIVNISESWFCLSHELWRSVVMDYLVTRFDEEIVDEIRLSTAKFFFAWLLEHQVVSADEGWSTSKKSFPPFQTTQQRHTVFRSLDELPHYLAVMEDQTLGGMWHGRLRNLLELPQFYLRGYGITSPRLIYDTYRQYSQVKGEGDDTPILDKCLLFFKEDSDKKENLRFVSLLAQTAQFVVRTEDSEVSPIALIEKLRELAAARFSTTFLPRRYRAGIDKASASAAAVEDEVEAVAEADTDLKEGKNARIEVPTTTEDILAQLAARAAIREESSRPSSPSEAVVVDIFKQSKKTKKKHLEHFRGHSLKKIISYGEFRERRSGSNLSSNSDVTVAAKKIQRVWRKREARKIGENGAAREKQETNAAIRIQTAWKRKKRKDRDGPLQRFTKAALKIQHSWKRRMAQKLREQHLAAEKAQKEGKESGEKGGKGEHPSLKRVKGDDKAALKIQNSWRSRQTKRKNKAALKIQDSWKKKKKRNKTIISAQNSLSPSPNPDDEKKLKRRNSVSIARQTIEKRRRSISEQAGRLASSTPSPQPDVAIVVAAGGGGGGQEVVVTGGPTTDDRRASISESVNVTSNPLVEPTQDDEDSGKVNIALAYYDSIALELMAMTQLEMGEYEDAERSLSELTRNIGFGPAETETESQSGSGDEQSPEVPEESIMSWLQSRLLYGRVEDAQQRYHQAEKHYVSAWRMIVERFGRDHFLAVAPLHSLMDLRRRCRSFLDQSPRSNLGTAASVPDGHEGKLLIRTIAKACGFDSPEMAKAYKCIAEDFMSNGRFAQAHAYLSKALKICQWHYPKWHIEITNLENLMYSLTVDEEFDVNVSVVHDVDAYSSSDEEL